MIDTSESREALGQLSDDTGLGAKSTVELIDMAKQISVFEDVGRLKYIGQVISARDEKDAELVAEALRREGLNTYAFDVDPFLALQVVANTLGGKVVPHLIKLLNDTEFDQHRDCIAQSLGTIKDKRAMEPLRTAMAKYADNEEFVKQAVWALNVLGATVEPPDDSLIAKILIQKVCITEQPENPMDYDPDYLAQRLLSMGPACLNQLVTQILQTPTPKSRLGGHWPFAGEGPARVIAKFARQYPASDVPQKATIALVDSICEPGAVRPASDYYVVNVIYYLAWDVQGTSYPPPEDKMYDSSVLPAAKEDG
jgi:hypothetical protein